MHADVLQNLGGDNPSTYVNALKIGFTSTLVFSYQFNIFAARPSLDALLFSGSEQEGGPCATPTSWPRCVRWIHSRLTLAARSAALSLFENVSKV